MSTLPLSITAHQTDWEYRITLLLWTCCALSIAFIIVVPTIPAVVFLGAVLLYCVLFPVRPYQALTWSLVPWVIVLFGALSIIWSEQPMQSLRGAAQIALSVLAALMFAHGLRSRSFIAINHVRVHRFKRGLSLCAVTRPEIVKKISTPVNPPRKMTAPYRFDVSKLCHYLPGDSWLSAPAGIAIKVKYRSQATDAQGAYHYPALVASRLAGVRGQGTLTGLNPQPGCQTRTSLRVSLVVVIALSFL